MADEAWMSPVPNETVSADEARDYFKSGLAALDTTQFSCPDCRVEYQGAGFLPDKKYKVSPYFSLPNGETHGEDCPRKLAVNPQAAAIHKAIRKTVPRAECDGVPGELLLPPTSVAVTAGATADGQDGNSGAATQGYQNVVVPEAGVAPVRTTTIRGIVGFRNRVWSEMLKLNVSSKDIASALRTVSLRLPSGPTNYDQAFSDIIYPRSSTRIYWGKKFEMAITPTLVRLTSPTSMINSSGPFEAWNGFSCAVELALDSRRRRIIQGLWESFAAARASVDWFAYGDLALSTTHPDEVVLTALHPSYLFIKRSYIKPAAGSA